MILQQIRSRSGFTLVELLIGILMACIVVYAAMSLYVTQHKEMIVQEQVSDMQNNIRAAAEVIARAARMAGYNTPETMEAIETHNTNPDTIVITYDSGILEAVVLEYPMASVTADLRCDGHNLEEISAQDNPDSGAD